MRMPERTEQLWNADPGEGIVVHTGSDGSEVVVTPAEADTFSEFDLRIRVEGGRGYGVMNPPSQSDVFRDLHEKRTTDEVAAGRLFDAIEAVYEGDSPAEYADELGGLDFGEEGFPADVTVAVIQAMMAKQEILYGPDGKWTGYDPPRDLLMSCVRWIESGGYDDISDVVSGGLIGRTPDRFQLDDGDVWTRPEY